MTPLTLDLVRAALPDLDELRPILDHLLSRSEPDPSEAWSGSGALGTLGSRVVSEERLTADIGIVAAEEGELLMRLYALSAEALSALAADEPSKAAQAFLEAAALEEHRDRPERAAAYAEAAYRAVRPSRDSVTTSLALRRLARALRAQGALEEACARYAHAYEVAVAAFAPPTAVAEAAIGAGTALEGQGQWDDAGAWYHRALEALEEVEGPVAERWHAFLTLHIVLRTSGRLEESHRWLERAVEEAAVLDDASATAYIENAKGQLAMAENDFEAADDHLRSALLAAENALSRVVIQLNLAESLLARGRSLDAMVCARDAERDAIKAGLTPKLPEVYRLLGRVASSDGNPDAFVLFERALEVSRERGLPALEEALTLHAYADAEEERGETEAAEELRRQAADRFERLGIEHRRHTWADVYGPGTRNPAKRQD